MRHLSRLLLALLLLIPAAFVAAQGDGAITFVPFENQAAGLAGIVPEGWEEAQPGLYVGGTLGPNLIFQFADGVDTAAEVMPTLTGQIGLAEEPTGTAHASPTRAWLLYHFRIQPEQDLPLEVDMAVTDSAGGPLVIMLQALPEDYEGLFDTVFLPVVDALTITPVAVATTVAPDAPLTLEPFADALFGIGGVRPVGWRDLGSGEVRRQQTVTDVTTLIQQVAPGITADVVMPRLAPNFGAEEVPEALGTLTTAAYTWTFYTFAGSVGGATATLSVAVAEGADGVVLVLLVSAPDEHSTLYDTGFLPAVRALAPLQAAGDVPLTAFTAEELGLQGQAPAAWEEAQPGYFVAPEPGAALTFDRLTGETVESAIALLAERLELGYVPPLDETREAGQYTWTIHSFVISAESIPVSLDVGLTQAGADVLVVALQSTPAARDGLVQAVFYPALEALTLLDAPGG